MKPLLEHHGLNLTLAVAEAPVGWTVTWGDLVVNEWTERYRDLSTALARAAVLVAIDEERFGADATMFSQGTEAGFGPAAEAFLDSQITE